MATTKDYKKFPHGTAEHDRELQEKAAAQEAPTFTLVGWDRTTPDTMRDWAIRAARLGAPAEKVGSVLVYAAEIERWQLEHGSKIPD
jgi:hypothetical protein